MLTFQKIKNYYDHKLWSKDWVKNAVVKDVITPEQYQEITDEIYKD